jgi:hypothetical protein
MEAVITPLLPFIIGSALVPLQIIVVVLLLTSEMRGPLKAILFVLGMTMVRLAQWGLFGLVLAGDSADSVERLGWFKAGLLVALGIMLLVTAYKKWAKESDPDAPPPKWLAMLDGVTPPRALLFGAGFILIAPKLWVFTLGAISVIGEAGLEQRGGTIAFLVYMLLAQSLLLLPILVRLVLPRQAAGWLRSFGDWLEQYNDPIVMVVSLVFGVLFLYQGLSNFL